MKNGGWTWQKNSKRKMYKTIKCLNLKSPLKIKGITKENNAKKWGFMCIRSALSKRQFLGLSLRRSSKYKFVSTKIIGLYKWLFNAYSIKWITQANPPLLKNKILYIRQKEKLFFPPLEWLSSLDSSINQ